MPLAELVPALAFLSPPDSISAMVCRYLAMAASVLTPSCGPDDPAGLPDASGALAVSVFSSLGLPDATAPGSLPSLAAFILSAAALTTSSAASFALLALPNLSSAAFILASAALRSKSVVALPFCSTALAYSWLASARSLRALSLSSSALASCVNADFCCAANVFNI